MHREKIKLVAQNIKRHTSRIRSEVSWKHIREENDARLQALDHFEKAERSNRRQEYHTIETDISPIFYDKKLDWVQCRVCEGSGKWLFVDSIFLKWLDATDLTMKIVMLLGIPGAGRLKLLF